MQIWQQHIVQARILRHVGPSIASRALVRRCATQESPAATASPPQDVKSKDKPDKQEPRKGKGGAKAQPTSSAEDIRAVRLQKVDDLRKTGQNPYAYGFERTHFSTDLQEKYTQLGDGEEDASADVAIAGRIVARRVMGKLAFVGVRDDRGQIQLYIDKARLEEGQPGGFDMLKGLVDIGDIVGARGSIKRTEKGELSVVATSLQVLTKALLPLPDKWHGLSDVEKRYRQRYLDLIVTPSARAAVRSRSLIVSHIRRYLEDRGYLEVETPVLESVAGGADARPFVTYHNSLQRNFTLRIATELHLKRLLVGGFERVFELGRVFRNEGVSSRHNPEFTSVELYCAYADYTTMMDVAQGLLRACALAVCGSLQVPYQGEVIDLEPPFRCASMNDLVKEATGVDFLAFGSDLAAAREAVPGALASAGAPSAARSKALTSAAAAQSVGVVLSEVFEATVEGGLQQPTFVTEQPVEISPLAKPHRLRPQVTERFELFIAGRELANAFSELNDPLEQRQRFESQVASHRAAQAAAVQQRAEARAAADGAGGAGADADEDADEAYDVAVDEDFLTALEYGMPPAGGMGIGVDRLAMLLTDSASIRDVIAFPLMK